MKKVLKKPLVYLLAAMMMFPTWLVTGYASAQHAKAADYNSYKFVVSGQQLNYPALSDLSATPSKGTDAAIAFPGNNGISVSVAIDQDNGLSYPNNVIVLPVSAGNDIQLWAKDTVGNWWDINKVGWGDPSKGFPVDLSAVTQVYPVMKEGLHPIDLKLVDFTNQQKIVAEYKGTLVSDHTAPIISEYGLNGKSESVSFNPANSSVDISLTTDELAKFNRISIINSDGQEIRYFTATSNFQTVVNKIWNGKTGSADNSPLAADGQYKVKVKVTDQNNNQQEYLLDSKIITLDTTAPSLVLNNAAEIVIPFGQTYQEFGAVATDSTGENLTSKINVETPADLTAGTPGAYTVKYNVTDAAGNPAAEVTRKVTLLAQGQQTITPNLTLADDNADIFVPSNIAEDSTITVPANVNNTTLNLSDFDHPDGSVNLSHTITIVKEIQEEGKSSTVTFVIPAGKISGLTADGKFALPSIRSLEIPVQAGSYSTVITATAIGYSDSSISFESPVKVTFAGQAGKLIGFTGPDGKFQQINNTCYFANGKTTPDLNAGDACQESNSANSADLTIWTTHFTTFATYLETQVLAPDFSATTYEKDGSKWIKTTWQGTGADQYFVLIDGVIVNNGTVAGQANDAATSYSIETKILSYGKHNVSVVAKKNGVSSLKNKTKTVELSAPVITPAPVAQPVETAPAPMNAIAPQKAQAAAPAVNPSPSPTPSVSDDNGKIKGDENTGNSEEDKVNWTPWIVLFVLIILAGAATGGYFYWFAGEDEVESVVRAPKEEKKIEKAHPATAPVRRNDKKPNKKSKRW